MGGQNHQPCNQPGTSYLEFSTQMSLECSKARASLELANIELEQVLLRELGVSDIKASSASTICAPFGQSLDALERMQQAVSALRSDMLAHEFKDLPELNSTNLLELGARLKEAGLVEHDAWEIVAHTMTSIGFYGILDLFENHILHLLTLTAGIHDVFVSNKMRQAVRSGQLNHVVEENHAGNFKVEFARLYTAWLEFQQLFLASSMLSTELWYRHQKVGSLLDCTRQTQAA